MRKGILALVLDAFEGSCTKVAKSSKKEKPDELSPIMNAAIGMISAMSSIGDTNEMIMFRTMLINAELTPDESLEMDVVLARVESQHTCQMVLDSVQLIRTNTQSSLAETRR
jgi:membrane-bound ClpP family serine protease